MVANPAADLLELDSGALVPVVFVTEHDDGRSSSTRRKACSRTDEAKRDAHRRVHDLPRRGRRLLLGEPARQGPTAGLLDLRCHDLRDHTTDVHRTVDDAPFGGGAGMVMKAEPIFAAVEAAEPPRPLFLLGPGGRRFDQAMATELAAGAASACCAAATRGSTIGSASTSSTVS